MSSKLRIKIGDVEIDCEGTEDFLKQELPQLLTTAMELRKAVGKPQISPNNDKHAQGGIGTGSSEVPSMTTAAIAARIGVNSGSGLLKAAAAHLTLVKGVASYSRQQLLAEMQSATSYYKKNYSPNLSKYIKTALQKEGFLSETATNSYALTAAASAALEADLANT